MINKTTPQPTLKKLASGVYAWIGLNGDSNSGAVTTCDGLIAIDAQQSAMQGRAFRNAVETAAGAPVTQLINTHFHLDHTAGNVAFEDVAIIAQKKTPLLMNEYIGTSGKSRWRIPDVNQRLRLFFGSNFETLVPTNDPLHDWFVMRVQRPELTSLELVAPDHMIEESQAFHRADGVMHIRYVGPAHCDGEVLIHLPDQKIAFLGDLLFVGRFPWLGDCDLHAWIDCLTGIYKMDLNQIVPGHGDVCSLEEVENFRALLMALRDAVRSRISDGDSEASAMQSVRLPQYAHLPRYREWLPSNIRAVYRYLKQG